MCSKALILDSRMKKNLDIIKCLKWEHDMMLKRHHLRLRTMKPSVDSKSPDRAPFNTLKAKKFQLERDRINKLERRNLAILSRLRAINDVKVPEFCHWIKRARARGEAYRLRPATGRRKFRFDWQALKGSTERKSLRKQEEILRKLIQDSEKSEPVEAMKLKQFLPKPEGAAVEYLEYGEKQDLSISAASGTSCNDTSLGTEDLASKLAGMRLQNPPDLSPYDHSKQKKTF